MMSIDLIELSNFDFDVAYFVAWTAKPNQPASWYKGMAHRLLRQLLR